MRETVLRALSELDRWTRRQEQLRDALVMARGGALADGRTAEELRAELEKVNRQVAYYQALTQDMKRTARPSRISDMLRSMLAF